MQSLIPLFVILGLASGTHLTLLPYAYLADPLPVYHQSQNTRTGEHAYSYAGGPSAKEEVKGPDGVTRGSYSYVDANGLLQSVFYVADEGGFRVAATNLPSDDDLSAQVLLAHGDSSSRRKRSLEDVERVPDQDGSQEKALRDGDDDQSAAESVHQLVYEVPDSVFIQKLLPTATSSQSQVQVHRNVQVEPVPAQVGKILAEPVYEPVILSREVPLATSHQSRVDVHNNLRLSVAQPELLRVNEPLHLVQAPLSPFVAYQSIDSVPLVAPLPSYHENRIQLHRNIGLEGPERKDAVKIHPEPLAVVHPPVVSTVLAKTVPVAEATVTTSVSSHGISQIHGDSKVNVSPAILTESPVLLKTAEIQQVQPVLGVLHALPYARASQFRTQIHGN